MQAENCIWRITIYFLRVMNSVQGIMPIPNEHNRERYVSIRAQYLVITATTAVASSEHISSTDRSFFFFLFFNLFFFSCRVIIETTKKKALEVRIGKSRSIANTPTERPQEQGMNTATIARKFV